MKKYLFLDDERMPKDVNWIRIDKSADWQIVRSYDQAVAWVLENGFPDVISFDHDLGHAHYGHDYSDGKTGYDFAKWLVEHDRNTNTMPDTFEFTVHSMNPIGAENIRRYIFNYIVFRKMS